MKAKLILPLIAMAGCTTPAVEGAFAPTDTPVTVAAPPPTNATTVDQFDTTTPEARAAAVTPVSGGDVSLGTTIASLGPPGEPGIWLKTPLVTAVSQGRVVFNGTSVNVELRPSGTAAGSGSQLSLAAMRLLGAPLTSLPEVAVFRQ